MRLNLPERQPVLRNHVRGRTEPGVVVLHKEMTIVQQPRVLLGDFRRDVRLTVLTMLRELVAEVARWFMLFPPQRRERFG